MVKMIDNSDKFNCSPLNLMKKLFSATLSKWHQAGISFRNLFQLFFNDHSPWKPTIFAEVGSEKFSLKLGSKIKNLEPELQN